MKKALFIAAGMAVLAASNAAPITPGNLVIYRVGDGSAALGTSATKVYLDEYTTSGTLVQSIAVSSVGASAMTAVGNATTEGILNLSQDGSRIVMTGYRRDAGLASATASNKVIGTIDITGVANTGLEVSDIGTATIRSATTVDGSLFYGGFSNGVRWIPSPTGTSTSVLLENRNSRQVMLNGNTLYASNGSTALTAKVQHYGVLPTSATAATPMINLATSDAVNGFVLLDQSSSIAGVDTAYVLSTVVNKLLKFEFDGANWVARGENSAASAANLVAMQGSTGVDLYLTSGSKLMKYTDATGFGGSLPGGAAFTDLAVAATNTGFRGVNSLPVPEPGTMIALSVGVIAALRRRRK